MLQNEEFNIIDHRRVAESFVAVLVLVFDCCTSGSKFREDEEVHVEVQHRIQRPNYILQPSVGIISVLKVEVVLLTMHHHVSGRTGT